MMWYFFQKFLSMEPCYCHSNNGIAKGVDFQFSNFLMTKWFQEKDLIFKNYEYSSFTQKGPVEDA